MTGALQSITPAGWLFVGVLVFAVFVGPFLLMLVSVFRDGGS